MRFNTTLVKVLYRADTTGRTGRKVSIQLLLRFYVGCVRRYRSFVCVSIQLLLRFYQFIRIICLCLIRFNTTLVKVLLLEEKQVLLKAYCFNTTLVKVLYHVNTTVTRTWDVSIQLLLRFYQFLFPWLQIHRRFQYNSC